MSDGSFDEAEWEERLTRVTTLAELPDENLLRTLNDLQGEIVRTGDPRQRRRGWELHTALVAELARRYPAEH